MANDVRLEITGDPSGLVAALEEAQAVVAEKAEEMKESLMKVNEAFTAISEAMVVFTAVLAGGAAFGEIVQGFVKTNVEAASLGRQFGISATEAGVLREALNATHVTQEQFDAAGARIVKTLNSNEQAFIDLGVATRDANGNLRPLADIVLDTNTALLKFKEGTDRAVEAQKVYGRGWQEILPTLKLTQQAMEEARRTSEELGYTVTAQSEALTNEYRNAVTGVNEVMERLEGTIAQAVLPALTQLGEEFRSIGGGVLEAARSALEALKVEFGALADSVKTLWQAFSDFVGVFRDGISEAFGGEPLSAMEFFKNTLKVVEVAFLGFRTGIQLAVQMIRNNFESLVDVVGLWASVTERAFHLDWAGVQAAWKTGNAIIEADEAAHFQKLVAISAQGAKDMNAAIMAQMGALPKQTPTQTPGGGKGASPGDDGKKFDKQLDAWIKELDLEYAALQKQHEAELEVYKQQEAEFSKNAAIRVGIAEQEVEAEARAYGKGSPQYERAQLHLVEIKRQAAEQLARIAETYNKAETDSALRAIADQEKALEQQFQHHEISNAQLESGLIVLENRKTSILEAGINARKALFDPATDPEQVAQLNAQLEALEREHQARLTQIRQQAAQQDRKNWDALNSSLEKDFSQSIAKMLEGTQSFSQGMRALFVSMTKSIIESFAQMAAHNIETMLAQALVGKTLRAQEIRGDAGAAAAATYKSVASIPYVGWILAPAAAAVAYGAVAAFDSAEGGYDIPNTDPGAVKLHPREMVLPKEYADVIRSLAVSGDGRAGGSGAITYAIQATDAKSFERQLRGNGSLAKTMRGLHARGVRG